MKTDSLFYSLFQEFPGILLELLGKPTTSAASYQFTSVEVKQLSLRIDGLCLPTSDDPNQPFYLVEVQFQADEQLYYRIFSELFIYLKQYEPPHRWQVVVIYPNRGVEKERELHFDNILTIKNISRIYLDELGEEANSSLGVGVVKLILEEKTTAVEKAKSLIEQAKQQLTDEKTQRKLISLVEMIIVYKIAKKGWEEIKNMLGLSDFRQTRAYQEAYTEGEQIGAERGEQIGAKKNQLANIIRMLKLDLSLETIAQSLDLPKKIVRQKAKQYVAAFIKLLKNQSSLFSPEDKQQLVELIAPSQNKLEALVQAIYTWLEQQPDIGKAQQQILSEMLEQEEQLRETTGEPPKSQYKANKKILQTAIEQLS